MVAYSAWLHVVVIHSAFSYTGNNSVAVSVKTTEQNNTQGS